MKTKVAILGGGLTGLTLAYLLKRAGIEFLVIEARSRLGGRILTSRKSGMAPIELGATWLGRKHKQLTNLLAELSLDYFVQELGRQAIYEPISTSPHQLVQLPPNTDPSFRIKGGSSQLIESLMKTIDPSSVILGHPVFRIKNSTKTISVHTDAHQVEADLVVSTLPPNLLVSSISFVPSLPKDLSDVAASTHTWMGDSIKVGLRSSEPFWRHPDYSGTIFSNVGPIPEMYDHSDFGDEFYALKGFLNGNYFSIAPTERRSLVLSQLSKYFDDHLDSVIEIVELVWRKEKYTYAEYEHHVLPHQNGGHAVYQKPHWNGRFWIGGSETSAQFPGYMEGAVASAQTIFQKIASAEVQA